MFPLRAEPSTVSIPPRERFAAKRKEKARKSKTSPSTVAERPTKRARQPAKAPIPTLAAQRQRRTNEYAYYAKRDGSLHVKQVARNPDTQGPALDVAYLPGQEDLPHSDAESDATDATVPELAGAAAWDALDMEFDVAAEAEEISAEPEHDLVDYDAEGEDEDEDIPMNDPDSASTTSYEAGSSRVEPDPSNFSDRPFAGSVDLLADANEEDMVALFGGLHNFQLGGSNWPTDFGFSNGYPGLPASDFASSAPHDANYGVRNTPQYSTYDGSSTQGPFAMHQLNKVVDDLHVECPSRPQSRSGLSTANHSAQPQFRHTSLLPLAIPDPWPRYINPTPGSSSLVNAPSPHIGATVAVHQSSCDHMPPPRRPASRVSTPLPSTTAPLPRLTRRDTPRPFISAHSGYLVSQSDGLNVPTASCSRPRPTTRELVSQTRAQIQRGDLHVQPLSLINSSLPHVLSDADDNSPALEPTPLRVSLRLPEFLRDGAPPDSDTSCPPSPVAFEDTDIGLHRDSPVQITRPRIVTYGNVCVEDDNLAGSSQVPTLVEVERKVREQLKISHRRHRGRHSTPAVESYHGRSVLRTGALTPNQRSVLASMEYHILRDVVCVAPWPSDRDSYLQAAVDYSIKMTNISGPDVFTPQFLESVWYKTSGNRGNSLTRIECMMEQQFGVTKHKKSKLFTLMRNNQFLFTTLDRKPCDYFHVDALGEALEIIFFKSAKPIGLVFIEDLCKPDNTVKSAGWHKKRSDLSASEGVPPAAIAFAAAQMYWALEKMYSGRAIHFDEQHFRGVWDRYLRALLKLPHLGKLRVNLLNQLKAYYMNHWPSEERDEDDDSFLAW